MPAATRNVFSLKVAKGLSLSCSRRPRPYLAILESKILQKASFLLQNAKDEFSVFDHAMQNGCTSNDVYREKTVAKNTNDTCNNDDMTRPSLACSFSLPPPGCFGGKTAWTAAGGAQRTSSRGLQQMLPLLGATLISLYRLISAAAKQILRTCRTFNRGMVLEKFQGTSIWTMKRRRLSAAEMADFSAISPRPDQLHTSKSRPNTM